MSVDDIQVVLAMAPGLFYRRCFQWAFLPEKVQCKLGELLPGRARARSVADGPVCRGLRICLVGS